MRTIYIINKILSQIARLVKWICNHWSILRKVIIILVLVGGFVYQFSLPEAREKINKSVKIAMMQRKQKAVSLKNEGDLVGAIDEYRQLITMITSQDNLSYIAVDDDLRYRVFEDAALLIIDYSKSYELTDTQQDMVSLLLDEFKTRQDKMDADIKFDEIFRDLQKLKDRRQ